VWEGSFLRLHVLTGTNGFVSPTEKKHFNRKYTRPASLPLQLFPQTHNAIPAHTATIPPQVRRSTTFPSAQ